MTFLKHFPKPLLDDLIHGRWLPVVGAGMSLNARTPPGKQLPLWPQLAIALEADMSDFDSSDPIDAISAYEHRFGRTRLVERLFELLLIREAIPGDAHREFCLLPFQIVCTTNFDFLLEDQYKATPRSVYPVVSEDQLSMTQPDSVTVLLKLHGDLHHPERMIVTENDYDGFLAKYPLLATYLSNQLITKTAILIGYNLDDPDFRQIWNVVAQRLGRSRRPAYALMVGANASDVARFERRGVHVINLPGRKARYGQILATAFRELREYWLTAVIGASSVKEEKPLRELKMPFDASSRLYARYCRRAEPSISLVHMFSIKRRALARRWILWLAKFAVRRKLILQCHPKQLANQTHRFITSRTQRLEMSSVRSVI